METIVWEIMFTLDYGDACMMNMANCKNAMARCIYAVGLWSVVRFCMTDEASFILFD
jgi:hypothetical protein